MPVGELESLLMFPCPHCGNPIQITGSSDRSWWQYANTRPSGSLGCGTLIAIAIIVAVFSQGGNEENALRMLHKDMQELQEKIDTLGSALKENPKTEP